jgi:hypothetical protein
MVSTATVIPLTSFNSASSRLAGARPPLRSPCMCVLLRLLLLVVVLRWLDGRRRRTHSSCQRVYGIAFPEKACVAHPHPHYPPTLPVAIAVVAQTVHHYRSASQWCLSDACNVPQRNLQHAPSAAATTTTTTTKNSLMDQWEKKQKRLAELDHRRIGLDNKLFMFHELSPGSCFFMPHGACAYARVVREQES